MNGRRSLRGADRIRRLREYIANLILTHYEASAPLSAVWRGRWGLIQVFPWTTEAEVTSKYKTIRGKIAGCRRSRHPRKPTKGQVMDWLKKRAVTLKDLARRETRRPAFSPRCWRPGGGRTVPCPCSGASPRRLVCLRRNC
jgi:hypothetical protein